MQDPQAPQQTQNQHAADVLRAAMAGRAVALAREQMWARQSAASVTSTRAAIASRVSRYGPDAPSVARCGVILDRQVDRLARHLETVRDLEAAQADDQALLDRALAAIGTESLNQRARLDYLRGLLRDIGTALATIDVESLPTVTMLEIARAHAARARAEGGQRCITVCDLERIAALRRTVLENPWRTVCLYREGAAAR